MKLFGLCALFKNKFAKVNSVVSFMRICVLRSVDSYMRVELLLYVYEIMLLLACLLIF